VDITRRRRNSTMGKNNCIGWTPKITGKNTQLLFKCEHVTHKFVLVIVNETWIVTNKLT
jgi:hypothetical protein